MNSDIIKQCERIGIVLGLIVIVLSVATGQSIATTLGISAGALLGVANFVSLRILVSKVLDATTTNASVGPWAILFILKLALMTAFVFLAVKVLGATVMGVLVGVSAVLASVILTSIFGASRNPDDLVATRGGVDGSKG